MSEPSFTTQSDHGFSEATITFLPCPLDRPECKGLTLRPCVEAAGCVRCGQSIGALP